MLSASEVVASEIHVLVKSDFFLLLFRKVNWALSSGRFVVHPGWYEFPLLPI